MTLGTAASRSTAYVMGPRSRLGAYSVRKSATPRLSGTAMTSAMTEVTIVP